MSEKPEICSYYTPSRQPQFGIPEIEKSSDIKIKVAAFKSKSKTSS